MYIRICVGVYVYMHLHVDSESFIFSRLEWFTAKVYKLAWNATRSKFPLVYSIYLHTLRRGRLIKQVGCSPAC